MPISTEGHGFLAENFGGSRRRFKRYLRQIRRSFISLFKEISVGSVKSEINAHPLGKDIPKMNRFTKNLKTPVSKCIDVPTRFLISSTSFHNNTISAMCIN